MRYVLVLVALTLGGVGCSSTPSLSDPPPKLTAEVARSSLLELLRCEPDAFIGNPDPDRLAKIPLTDRGDGKFGWGLFVIDPVARTYSADLVPSGGGEAYFYSGKFELRWRQWTASTPNVQRVHQQQ